MISCLDRKKAQLNLCWSSSETAVPGRNSQSVDLHYVLKALEKSWMDISFQTFWFIQFRTLRNVMRTLDISYRAFSGFLWPLQSCDHLTPKFSFWPSNPKHVKSDFLFLWTRASMTFKTPMEIPVSDIEHWTLTLITGPCLPCLFAFSL